VVVVGAGVVVVAVRVGDLMTGVSFGLVGVVLLTDACDCCCDASLGLSGAGCDVFNGLFFSSSSSSES